MLSPLQNNCFRLDCRTSFAP